MLFYRCILPFLTFNLPRLLRRLTLLQGLLPPLAFFGFRALRFICRIGGNANIEVVAIIENNDDTGFKPFQAEKSPITRSYLQQLPLHKL